MSNFGGEPERTRQHQDVVATAQAMLDGQLGVVAGSRRLCVLRSVVAVAEHDPDFLLFVDIDSETDHLPIGETRQHWAADALVAKDVELQAVEARYDKLAMSGCRRLVERFSVHPLIRT